MNRHEKYEAVHNNEDDRTSKNFLDNHMIKDMTLSICVWKR